MVVLCRCWLGAPSERRRFVWDGYFVWAVEFVLVVC